MERVAEKSEAAVALTKPAALLPTISIGFNYAIKTLETASRTISVRP